MGPNTAQPGPQGARWPHPVPCTKCRPVPPIRCRPYPRCNLSIIHHPPPPLQRHPCALPCTIPTPIIIPFTISFMFTRITREAPTYRFLDSTLLSVTFDCSTRSTPHQRVTSFRPFIPPLFFAFFVPLLFSRERNASGGLISLGVTERLW